MVISGIISTQDNFCCPQVVVIGAGHAHFWAFVFFILYLVFSGVIFYVSCILVDVRVNRGSGVGGVGDDGSDCVCFRHMFDGYRQVHLARRKGIRYLFSHMFFGTVVIDDFSASLSLR